MCFAPLIRSRNVLHTLSENAYIFAIFGIASPGTACVWELVLRPSTSVVSVGASSPALPVPEKHSPPTRALFPPSSRKKSFQAEHIYISPLSVHIGLEGANVNLLAIRPLLTHSICSVTTRASRGLIALGTTNGNFVVWCRVVL